MAEQLSQAEGTRRHAPIILWCAILLVVLGGLSLKLYWDGRENAYESQKDLAIQAAEQRYLELLKRTDLQNLGRVSQTQLEAVIGANNPIHLSSHGSNYIADWTDPHSHAHFIFYFDSSQAFSGRRGLWHAWKVPSPPRTYTARTQEDFRLLGDYLAPRIGNFHWPLAMVPWVILYVQYRRRAHLRGIFAFLLASWTVLCVLIWLMGSERLLSLNAVLDHEPNFWAVIMLLLTWVTFYCGGLENQYTDPLACRACGYNLQGNQSGTCSECGAVVSAQQRTRLN